MPRYALIQRLLHWIIAVMVLGALTVGWTLGTLGFQGVLDTFGKEMTDTLYTYHKTFGVMILGLMLLRIALKLALPTPPHDPPLTDVERKASGAVHGILYVALVGMAVTGWLGTGAAGFPVQFFDWTLPPILSRDKATGELLLYTLHGVFGFIITICVFLHIGGALKHWLVNKDGVMRRISLF